MQSLMTARALPSLSRSRLPVSRCHCDECQCGCRYRYFHHLHTHTHTSGCDMGIREQHNGGVPNVDQVVRAHVCGVSPRWGRRMESCNTLAHVAAVHGGGARRAAGGAQRARVRVRSAQ